MPAAKKPRSGTRTSKRTRRRAPRNRWLRLAALGLVVALSLPVLEREALIWALGSASLSERGESLAYGYAQSVQRQQAPLSFWFYRASAGWGQSWLLSGRWSSTLQAYELNSLEALLAVDDYEGARELVLASVSGKDEPAIFSALLDYERDNFEDLRARYLEVEFDWSYDAYRVNIPQYMRPYIDRDFFSTFLPYEELRLRRYKPAGYDGIFLSLRLSNDFLALNPTGELSFKAEGNRDLKGTLKSIARTAMSGVSGIVDKSIETAVDVWNGRDLPKVSKLRAPPQTTAWHIGKAFKPGKGFKVEPQLAEVEWESR